MDSTFTDTRTQDRSRKHKHGSKSKGKGRAEADPYGGGGVGGEGKSLAYNVPQLSSDRSSQGDYYQNYSHYGSGGEQPYGTGSYVVQGGYGGQGGHAPSQGKSLYVMISGSHTYWSIHKYRDSAPVPLAHNTLPREASPISPLKQLSAAPTGTSIHSAGTCTSKEAEAEDHRQVVSDEAQVLLAYWLINNLTDRGSTYQAAAGDALSPPKSHSKSTKSDVIRGIPANSEYLDGSESDRPHYHKPSRPNTFRVPS